MINRIGDNGSYLRTEVKRDNHEKSDSTFTLEYKDKKKEEDGVKLELSTQSSDKINGKSDDVSVKKDKFVTQDEVVQKYTLYQSFREKWQELKDKSQEWIERFNLIWLRIWNGKEAVEQEKLKLNGKSATDSADRHKSITDMNMQEVSEYLSEGGRRKPARNADMLTTYNQFGRIVEVDPSEQNKIFHGNKPWKEL
ncbi:MAG: hypothetical protein PUD71_03790 [Lachnospiraceae bacterium]|nr:hypothetical protein [Lachnospiraceae bacterium]